MSEQVLTTIWGPLNTICEVSRGPEKSILRIIAAIRNSFKDSVAVYKNGGCFQFHLILKSIYGDYAIPFYDFDHVITKIGDYYYDITGNVEPTNRHFDLRSDEALYERAHNWKFEGKVEL